VNEAKKVRADIAANLAVCRKNAKRSAEEMIQSAELLREVNEHLDAHIERLEAGEEEITPPPFPVPFIKGAPK
jgi:hypothetical protein